MLYNYYHVIEVMAPNNNLQGVVSVLGYTQQLIDTWDLEFYWTMYSGLQSAGYLPSISLPLTFMFNNGDHINDLHYYRVMLPAADMLTVYKYLGLQWLQDISMYENVSALEKYRTIVASIANYGVAHTNTVLQIFNIPTVVWGYITSIDWGQVGHLETLIGNGTVQNQIDLCWYAHENNLSYPIADLHSIAVTPFNSHALVITPFDASLPQNYL